jgi:glucuronokinase
MIIIRKQAYARAGLLGNPSDGYNGKTISIIIRNFVASVVLYEWDTVDIILAQNDGASFGSIHDLARDVRLHGYYGGIRLIKATIKRFVEYCDHNSVQLHDRNFSIRYQSDIPRQVGLAGSSAIIVATLRCLMQFYNVAIPSELQPSLVLSVERDELGIAAGLQDRVIQVYEGAVYMNFDISVEHRMNGIVYYDYEPIDMELLPPLYLSFSNMLAEPTEVFHNDIRSRFNHGEEKVVTAMKHCAFLAEKGRSALVNRDYKTLNKLMNENFDTRRSIYSIAPWQVAMVETARSCGASATFAGSGGAVIGTYDSEEMFQRICGEMAKIGCITVKPQLTPEINS